MYSILHYILEKTEQYGDPDIIVHNSEEYNYNSKYAKPIIYNIKTYKTLFGNCSQSHNALLFNIDDKTREEFNLYKNDGITPIRWVDDLMDSHENRCGRIWVIPNNVSKHRKYDVYIAWWNELTSQEFNKFNSNVIADYNKEYHLEIESYIGIDNKGKFILVTPEKEYITIDKRDNNRKEDIKILKAIHLAPQKEKNTYFKAFRKNRDEQKQKIYNHTKSKTEAEWRSLRYQENLNNNNMKSLIEYILEKQRIVFGSANTNYGQCVILAGGAASGKGFIANKIDITGKTFDVDELKKKYMKLAKAGIFKDEREYDLRKPEDTAALHEKVKQIGSERYEKDPDKKTKQGLKNMERNAFWKMRDFSKKSEHSSGELPNVIFDMVSDNYKDIEEVATQAKANGYNVTLVWVVCNRDTAKTSNIIRGIGDKGTARSVPESVLLKGHEGAYKTISALFNNKYPELNEFIDIAWIGFSCGWGRMLGSKYEANPVVKVKKDGNNKFSWNEGEVTEFLKEQQPIDYSFLKSIELNPGTDKKSKYDKEKLAKFEQIAADFDEEKLKQATPKNLARNNALEKFKARKNKKSNMHQPEDIHESWELEYDTIEE